MSNKTFACWLGFIGAAFILMFTIWTPIVMEASWQRSQRLKQIMDNTSGKVVDYSIKDQSNVHIHFKDGSDLYLHGHKGLYISDTKK